MSTVYDHDLRWFVHHPTAYCYQRPPLPHEWPDLVVPPDAVVTVHLINHRCIVRVLALPGGPRLAEVLDTDPVPVVRGRWVVRKPVPRHVWG